MSVRTRAERRNASGSTRRGRLAWLDRRPIQPPATRRAQNQLDRINSPIGCGTRWGRLSAAKIIGDLNYVHPFREGNGRMQYQFLKQLGARAGHAIDLKKLRGADWMRASIAAHEGRYGRMAVLIHRAIRNGQSRPPRSSATQTRAIPTAPLNRSRRGGRAR